MRLIRSTRALLRPVLLVATALVALCLDPATPRAADPVVTVASLNPDSGVWMTPCCEIGPCLQVIQATPFTISCPAGTPVRLVAPAMVGETPFTEWRRPELPPTPSTTLIFVPDTNVTVTVVYGNPVEAHADFVVTGIALTPASPVSGTPFGAQVTVKNLGPGAQPLTAWLDLWTDRSSAPACNVTGNAYRAFGNLAAGASTVMTFTGLTAGPAGGATFRAFADSLCEVAEADETNNQATLAYTVRPRSTLSVASENPANAVIALSPADLLGLAGGTAPYSRSYDPGATVTLIAPEEADGRVFQKWRQDGLDFAATPAATVTMDTNHTLTAVYVVPPRPDFVVTGITLPEVPTAGFAFRASVTVRNQGTLAGDGGTLAIWTHKIFNNNCTWTDATRWQSVGALLPGESRTFDFTGLGPLAASGSTRYFRAYVDSMCATTELSDTNNQSYLGYVVADRETKWVIVDTLDGRHVDIAHTMDVTGEVGGSTRFTRTYPKGATVRITAPATTPDGGVFQKWSGLQPWVPTTTVIDVAMDTDKWIKAVYVGPGVPDFAVTGLILDPPNPPAGGTFSATVTLTNVGTGRGVPGSLDLFPDRDTPANCFAGTIYGPMYIYDLGPGESRTWTISDIPAGARGAKHLLAFADTMCETDEPDEENNQIFVPYEVVNVAPVLGGIGDRIVVEGDLLGFTVAATDANGETPVFDATGLPDGASFDPATRTFTWRPGYDQAGTYPGVRFIASDAEASDDETITITVVDRPGFPDSTTPRSTILDPASGAKFMAPTYRIAGSAADTGSGLERVEISFNSGGWITAAGTTSWDYDWAVPADGVFTIRSRATDKAGNVEDPGDGVTVTAYRRAPSAFTVSGRKLLLDSDPFTIKGVVFSPVPVGVDPEATAPFGDYFTPDYAAIQDRDLSLLRQMGANAVLISSWGNGADHRAFLDKAYNGGLNPIYVIAGFQIAPGLDIDPASPANVRDPIKAAFLDMVEAHRNHPALLFWSIGGDLNTPGMYGGDLDNLFSLVDELAVVAHTAEGGSAHPVAAGLADVNLSSTISAYDDAVPNLDLWGVTVYRGESFGPLFSEYAAASGKPLAILGYGIDAFDGTQGDEYENLGAPLQGDYAVALWQEIQAGNDGCVGGTITEYSDQWWRGKHADGAGCPDADPAVQSACGQFDATEPDGFLNEEWQGLVRIAAAGAGPDVVEPREAYYALQYLWVPPGLNPSITESPQVLPSFGSVNIGLTSAEQTVTFGNTGATNLVMGTIAIAGTNPADFAVRSDGCSGRTLVPADSCAVGVVFTPSALNARKATLSVPSSDQTRGTVIMPLEGNGIDTLPPTGTVAINGGDVATRAGAVRLTLAAVDLGVGPIRMCISNTGACSAWMTVTSPKSWTLPAGNGAKTVNVWFRDQWGNTSAAPHNDTIVVDTIKPSNGKVAVARGIAQLGVSWTGFGDGAAGSGIVGFKAVFRKGSAPLSCAAGMPVPDYGGKLPALVHTGLTNGVTYGYRICAIDAAGNMSTGATATGRPVPELDPPTGSVTINGGDAATRSTAATLTLAAVDAGGGSVRMCISNTATCNSWTEFAATKRWTLRVGSGTKTVNVWFRDKRGNTSATPVSDTIQMDTTKPTNGTVTVAPGDAQLAMSWDGFDDGTGSGVTSYRAVFQVGSAPLSCTSGKPVPGYEGAAETLVHTGLVNGKAYGYRVCARDAAGNLSLGATGTGIPVP